MCNLVPTRRPRLRYVHCEAGAPQAASSRVGCMNIVSVNCAFDTRRWAGETVRDGVCKPRPRLRYSRSFALAVTLSHKLQHALPAGRPEAPASVRAAILKGLHQESGSDSSASREGRRFSMFQMRGKKKRSQRLQCVDSTCIQAANTRACFRKPQVLWLEPCRRVSCELTVHAGRRSAPVQVGGSAGGSTSGRPLPLSTWTRNSCRCFTANLCVNTSALGPRHGLLLVAVPGPAGGRTLRGREGN